MKEVKVKMVVDSTQAKEGVDNVTGSLDKMTGGAVTGFKAFSKGLKSVAAGFKTVGGAIALSGLGLLVITIAAISAAFKGSEEGQNKFAKLMGTIGAVTGNLIDVLADFGDMVIGVFEDPKQAIKDFSNLIKENITNRFEGMLELIPELGKAIGLLFSGKFGEAAETAGNAMGKVALGVSNVSGKLREAGQSMADFAEQNRLEAIAAGKVADQRAKATKIERGLLVDRAKAENEIAELRLVAKDLNNTTAKERETALLKVMALEDTLIGREQEVANLRRDAQIAENGFARSTTENLNEEERLKAEAIAVGTRRLNKQRAVQRELTQAENQINSEKKAISDQAIADQKIIDDAAEVTRKEQAAADKVTATEKKANLKSIDDFKKNLITKGEDEDAVTEERKLELERERAELALENLIGTETEKAEALLELNNYYDEREIELAKTTAETITANEEAEIEKRKELEEEAIATKFKIAKQGIQATTDLSRAAFTLMDRFGKKDEKNKEKRAKAAFVIQKTLSLAATGVKGAEAIMTSLSTAPLAIGPVPNPAGIASLAAVIASTTASLATIAASSFQGGASEPTRPDSSVGGGNGAQAPSFNLVEGSADNQIQNSIQNSNDAPIKAFVVAQDVTSQQSLDRQIEQNAGV